MDKLAIQLLFGLITLNFYVEDRGETAITRYKHFLEIRICRIWVIRFTIRSPYVYPIYINGLEYLPKLYEIKITEFR